jgi:hypothetical protein
MKRIGYTSLAAVALLIGAATFAFATPAPNSAHIETRIFNDCPTSTVGTTNLYPALVSISDTMNPACVGFANLHIWGFSENGGVDQSLFINNSHYQFSADVTIAGNGEGEGGLRLAPWWFRGDGRFMINASTGEIACFAGRLPFYTFTVGHGITYVKGTTVKMEITYLANGLSMGSPATIEYKYTDNSGTYSSGALAFDEGNTTQNPPYGLWGALNDATVGGYFQPRANTGADLTASWQNIVFTNMDVVPVEKSSWGRLKTLYR